jgi:phosphomannomutase
MTLIKSISGIRGTIGGKPGEGLSPLDVVKFTAAYAAWVKSRGFQSKVTIVVGRDARISGTMVSSLVISTLTGMGCNVVDIGLASTPTTEIAVTEEKADGGIIITASHNPKHWNALKLLNHKGEFLSAAEGESILTSAEAEDFCFASIDEIGTIIKKDYTDRHIEMVKNLELVDVEAIRDAGFKIAIDAVNSVGGIVLPSLLKSLGVADILEINCEPTGRFAHNPEPLAQHLTGTCELIRKANVDAGFVTDPDVDRLAIINEDGSLFNEEYTLVACADYVLGETPGNTVSNLSSSRALRDITVKHGGEYTASAVGEVNVVAVMKTNGAVIGGEGNGGIIYPALHYGRDALVGIALFLTYLAKSGLKCSGLRKTYPDYFMSKNKIELSPGITVEKILSKIKELYKEEKITAIDGVKIDFRDSWIHLRKSNTEPVIRIYAEALSTLEAEKIARDMIAVITELAERDAFKN